MSFEKARKILQQGDLQGGFSLLWSIKGTDLLGAKLFTKTEGQEAITLQSPQIPAFAQAAIDHFWQAFICQNQVYAQLLSSERVVHYMRTYFLVYGKASPAFLQKLAQEHPQVLIQSVRNYRAFLAPAFKKTLQGLSFNQATQIEHQRAWHYIAKTDDELWSPVEKYCERLNVRATAQLLLETSIWLEYEQFQGGNQNETNTQFLSRVYNLFITLCQAKGLMNGPTLSKEEFLRQYYQVRAQWVKNPNNYQNSALVKTLNALKAWTRFKETLLDLYCFSSEYNFEQTEALWLLATSPQEHYRFKLDGTRYGLNQFLYEDRAETVLNELINKSNKTLGKGTQPGDDEVNYQIARQAQAIWLMLKDLAFTQYGSHKALASIELLQAHASNFGYRYERQKKQWEANCSSYWELNSKMHTKSLCTGLQMVPFFYEPQDSYFEKIRSMSNNLLDQDHIASFINRLCYKHHSGIQQEFDRFNPQYASSTHPFIALGGYLFVPSPIFAITWFYALAQKCLKEVADNEGSEQSPLFEKKLLAYFQNTGFKALHTGQLQSKGDADLLVYDAQHLLLIQLKRTQLKLDHEALHKELHNTLGRASRQLLIYEEHIVANLEKADLPEDFPPLKGLEVHKWIVSTSFEHSAYQHLGSKKANFFEIVHALNGPSRYQSLKTFIDYMEKDTLLYDVMALLKKYPHRIADLPNLPMPPIPIFEPKVYRLPIRTNAQEDLSDHIHLLFAKALGLHREKKYEKALQLLERCKYLDPIDPEVHGTMANVYADMNNTQKAYHHFEKALQLIPHDPFIWRNYILYLRQNGAAYRPLMEEWCATYPFLAF